MLVDLSRAFMLLSLRLHERCLSLLQPGEGINMFVAISRNAIRPLAMAIALALALVSAPAHAEESAEESSGLSNELEHGGEPSISRFQSNKAFAAWQKEHRWVRLGLRFHGYLPAIDEHAALDVGAGIMIPVTTDLFMGLGVRAAFIGAWNPGSGCINRGGAGANAECSGGHVGGVDFRWKEPFVVDENGVTLTGGEAGRNGNALAGDDWDQHRRPAHVAQFALAIGGNYELTLPHIRFFQIFQPFVGGGVLLVWVHTYSDITADEFVLIDNPDNNAYDPDNLDPWSKQGPEVGGEVYGGFHINPSKLFRFVIEFGYQNVNVPLALLQKATNVPPDREFQAAHLEFRLSQFRFGGGFEFRF